MKKRTMILLFTGLLAAILLAGCGSNTDNNTNDNVTPAPTEETPGAAEEDAGVEDATGVDVVIKANNFSFEQEVYEVPAGSTVQLSIENIEGYHGLLVKGLDLEVAPNKPVTFVAEPGEYEIVCNIQCGVGHNDMKSTLVVN